MHLSRWAGGGGGRGGGAADVGGGFDVTSLPIVGDFWSFVEFFWPTIMTLVWGFCTFLTQDNFPGAGHLNRKTDLSDTNFQKGQRQDVNNYRPISIFPAFAKVFERIIYDQLFKYLSDNDLLVNCQSGFRTLHSKLTSSLEASNSWSVNIDNGLINGVIFIDLKKAFDTIDHKILLRKLASYGIDHRALKCFDSYLSDRQQSA